METIHRANIYTIGVLALDAVFGDYKCHALTLGVVGSGGYPLTGRKPPDFSGGKIHGGQGRNRTADTGIFNHPCRSSERHSTQNRSQFQARDG